MFGEKAINSPFTKHFANDATGSGFGKWLSVFVAKTDLFHGNDGLSSNRNSVKS